MSMAESFLTTAKDILMMLENIKRLDARVDRMAEDIRGIDRRLMKIEVMVDFAKQTPRKRTLNELP